MRSVVIVVTAVVAGSSAVACSSDAEPSVDAPSSPASATNIPAQVALANYEVIAGESGRFLAGLILSDNRLVAYGTVQMRFVRLDAAGQLVGQPSDPVVGTYLPVPGTEPGDPSGDAQAIAPSVVRGVYEVEGATFQEAGEWAVDVAARVKDVGVVQGSARFTVLQEPVAPGVGQEAPPSDNAVIGDDVPASELDSRATRQNDIPDPALHQRSIADAIERGEPSVIVFSTPVYCVSRFCGPVTDLIEDLERSYGDDAAFIHVEIWRDFEANEANPTAIEWLADPTGGITEPWLFLVDGDGTVVDRWDNLFVQDEVEDGLADLLDA